MISTDDLQSAFHTLVSAFSDRDIETLSALAHENIVFVGALSPVLIEGKSALLQFCQNFFTTYDTITVTPLDPRFQVLQSIGLAWGSAMLELQAKGMQPKTLYQRYSCTFGRSNGTWTVISMHQSWLLTKD